MSLQKPSEKFGVTAMSKVGLRARQLLGKFAGLFLTASQGVDEREDHCQIAITNVSLSGLQVVGKTDFAH